MAAEIISVRVIDPNLVQKRKSSQLGLKILKEAEMSSSMNGATGQSPLVFSGLPQMMIMMMMKMMMHTPVVGCVM